jgi:hypothetical protein
MRQISYFIATLKTKIARTPMRAVILGVVLLFAFMLLRSQRQIISEDPISCEPRNLKFHVGEGDILDEYTDISDKSCSKPIFEVDGKKLSIKTRCSRNPLNFFLLWSTKREDFRLKHFRVIDSIFKHHPDARLHIITSNMTIADFSFYTDRYDIVHHYLDTTTIFKDTPLDRWAQNIPQYKLGSNYFSHLTDAMRLALLWKYGGVYLDTDAIVIRNMEKVRNTLGVQHPSKVAVGEINGKYSLFTLITDKILLACLNISVEYCKITRGWSSFPFTEKTRILTKIIYNY